MKAVNLLPDAKVARGAVSAGRGPAGGAPDKQATIITGALCAVLVLALFAVFSYVKAGNKVTERQADLVHAQQAATAAKAQEVKLQPYGDFAKMAQARVSTVVQIASNRFDWEQVMRDLSRAIPSDVTLSDINGTVAPGVGSSSGSSASLRAGIAAPAIELAGCTTGQDAVARLMSRLRDIRGVTRVSLASSDKDGTGGGTGNTGGPCGLGAKPTFGLVVFFENDVLGTGATPAPAAGATGPSGPSGPTGSTTPSTSTSTTPVSATATPDSETNTKVSTK